MTNTYRLDLPDLNNRLEFLVQKTLKNALTLFWDENLTRNTSLCSDTGLCRHDSEPGGYFHIDHGKSFQIRECLLTKIPRRIWVNLS